MEKYDSGYIKDYLYNSIVSPEAKNELIGYANEAFYRIIETLKLVPEMAGRLKILEIGANPYFLTLLLKKYRNCDIYMTNYFGDECRERTQKIINEKYKEEHVFDFININVELEKLPFENEYFDCVLFCEIIEHLVYDPVFALYNLYRVLKRDYCLIFSTPNVYRYENIRKFNGERKHSIYDPYSGYGIYGRHNREYSLFEVSDLLTNCGFELEEIKTINSRIDFNYGSDKNYEKAEQGEYILAKAKKTRQFNFYYPEYLFRSRKNKKDIEEVTAITTTAEQQQLVIRSLADQASDVSAFVTRFYQECLSRDPDSAGLNEWVDWLESGAKTGADVAYGFVFSDEFIQRNVSNDRYIKILYRAIFNREPDSGGYSSWLGYLNTGKSRQWVLAGFINSQEFKNLCAAYGINPGSINT